MGGIQENSRLDGLDIARLVAFVGMVIVNFNVVMDGPADAGFLNAFVKALEGRAAATFVVLAGIGLGLAVKNDKGTQSVIDTIKRALFLLVLGLLNTLIFDADILHYYAFYFLFGVFCLRLSSPYLLTLMVLINIVFFIMLLVFDYDAGWNWADYNYVDFWTLAGFVRNLFFNGWHPVFPWLSFLLWGIVLSRLSLKERNTQNALIVFGFFGYLGVETLSFFCTNLFRGADPELLLLFATGPVPPFPLYIAAGISVASLVVGLCLKSARSLDKLGILRILLPAGRQTLSLYIGHIVVGMGTLEAFGMLGGQSVLSVLTAALLFCAVAIIYAYFYARRFKRGPIETLMRKATGF
ncbi:transporter [Terasakiella brassicae]|uniref:Transporter n=1 Tax=Terasakiella brassicae TaxID=1634917 RepID=A0A917F6M5_9PROT|nr:heparan-alpha-glucosaminide N-acetyltransferase domain-containing protein [Terasakiella brassicae]GGF52838.1 transporter [Terasakiella brassicae]